MKINLEKLERRQFFGCLDDARASRNQQKSRLGVLQNAFKFGQWHANHCCKFATVFGRRSVKKIHNLYFGTAKGLQHTFKAVCSTPSKPLHICSGDCTNVCEVQRWVKLLFAL